MRNLIVAVSVALTGCATVEQVRNMHSADLCFKAATGRFGGLPSSVYYETLANRGEDCSKYRDMISSRLRSEAQQDDAVNRAIGTLQSAQPKQTQIAPQNNIECRSIPIGGGQVKTSCW